MGTADVRTEREVVETYLVRVDRNLRIIFFGNILNALVTGLIAVVVYLVLNAFAPSVVAIPRPAFVGLLVGAASLVPAIGIKLVTWPIGLYLLARAALVDPNTLWFPAVFVVVSAVVVDYIPDQLLRPYVSGRSLHVGAVMLAYLFGPFLFGWYGIFLGPFLLVVVYEFGQCVVPWLLAPEEWSPESPARTDAFDGDDQPTEPSGEEAAEDDAADSEPTEHEESDENDSDASR
ncbi:AI-2E family transporter [Haloarculaceae archaeon H-GB2-1]|nr:AI-2E family transporter [Haloarculaceae archaeon H-GB11]MEA5408029.1 AI-2E family transporter [Haloarculaceae archaeon H-GB2-1]